MSKQEQLIGILVDLQNAVPDVQGAMIASFDGLPIASTLEEVEGSRVAAMAATVRALGVRVVETTGVGPFEEAVVRSEGGIFTVYEAGDLAALAVLSHVGANLGLVNLVARRAAALVADILAPTRYEPVRVPSAPAPEAYAPTTPAPVATPTPVTPAAAPAPSYAWQDDPSYQAATA